ncbi:uncharacterized protein LOC134851576 [Symsagittifera roscoffensis]|uniref:uncharacterized protein LOC134851576 n=1 Tax=Symsagittifera roscoffensis TaxID=84072 RepID=UPI00307BC387
MVFRIVSHVASLLTWLYLVQLLHCCCHDKDDSWNCARSLTPEELPREGDLEGEWYEMGRTYFPYEYKQSCNVFNFSYIATDDQGQKMHFLKMTAREENGQEKITYLTILQPNPPSGLLDFDFHHRSPTTFSKFQAYVIHFQRGEYMVLYACQNEVKAYLQAYVHKVKHAWILSRTPNMNEDTLARLQKELLSVGGIRNNQLSRVEQKKC